MPASPPKLPFVGAIAVRHFLSFLTVSLVLATFPASAQQTVPDRRLFLIEDADIPGGDISSQFDTTFDACQRACLATQACEAMTFNTKNGSCFLKSDSGPTAPFAGAWSARVLKADPEVLAQSAQRRAELPFIYSWEFDGARQQAEQLANEHVTNEWSAEDLLAEAAAAEQDGDLERAANLTGAALNLTDAPSDWADYARRQVLAAEQLEDGSALRDRAILAGVNGYLRAKTPAERHSVLVELARALEAVGRGGDTVKALRLAQSLQTRDDTAAYLADAAAKYGFRILETRVESDLARPRLCANFSEALAASGVDYASFVRLDDPALTVTASGYDLCVEGVKHGDRTTVTFRQGLPAADGQALLSSVDVTQYIRDRNPAVRFPGRGYLLPKGAEAALPVETVNTETLDLTLFRVTDRNLIRAFQNGFFSAPISDWQEYDFRDKVGSEIWSGTATVQSQTNADITTRLPMADALAGRPAGVYALRAAVPGADPYESPAGWQWFAVSDLGITSLSGVDGLHVVVRSLGSAAAKAGVTVDLISSANEVLASATTDATGHAVFDAGLTRGTGGAAPALLVARDGDSDLAFLSLTDPEFDLSDRGVEGREPSPPVDVWMTTDRGAYRAGEVVNVTALARDSNAAAVEGLPLTWVLFRPDGVESARGVSNDWTGGHVFSLPVADTAPRGVWRLELRAEADGPALTAGTFLVEDFLPERINFAATLSEDLRLGQVAELSLQADYLFGAPGADLAVEGETLLRAAEGLPEFPGFVFGQADDPFNAVMEPFAPARTDQAGKAVFPVYLPTVADPLRPLEARVTVRVAEGSGRPVERQITKRLTPSAPMVGIKPLFDGVVAENAEARFALIGAGTDGKPAPMAVTWELTRIQTDYQWYQSYGMWNWEPVTTRSRVAEGSATLGAEAIEIAAPVTWGEYELSVTRTDGAPASSSIRFAAGWYATADVTSTPDMLEASLDKPSYAAGETATLRIVPRSAGTALVTVMSNRVIEMKAVEVKEGENLIPLTVTDDWGAGVYVSASVLRPMDVAAGHNPARALGIAHASIAPGKRALTATVEVAETADPRGPLPIAVKVDGIAAGETAFVTIAAVDQGILNLTAYTPPDPQGWYFGQRKLGVGIRDVYGRLIDGLNGAEGVVRSGGDAGANARLKSPPPTEKLLAFYTGPIEVGADGYARTEFTLPAFNGQVKVMAVAWSKSGIGQAHADVLVRDPVVVTATLPRFLSPGDDSRLLLELTHATGPAGKMALAVTAQGVTLGAVPASVDLGEKQKQTLAIPVTADAPGLASVQVTLTTPDGRALTKSLALPVQVNDPEVARISRFDLAKGQTFTFDASVFTGLAPGARATLAAGPIARLNAPGLLAALDRYPYGCTEQMASKVLPLLYFDDIAVAMGLEHSDDLRTRIQQSIGELLANQGAEGAFGLWSPGSGDPWLDAFVTDVLSRAKARGFDVPDRGFRMALDNLRNQVNYAPDFDQGGEALAYALMVLAREGAAAIGDLRYYADVKGDAFATPTAMAQLGAALALYGEQTRADAMFARAATLLDAQQGPETEQIFRADYGTTYRDAAAVLSLAVESGSNAVDREALTDRIATQGQLSTQEATWALLAANALIDRRGAEGLTIDGQPAEGPLVRMADAASLQPVAVRNDGPDTTLTVTTFGVPTDPLTAAGNGYAITRTYLTLDGEPANPDGVPVGTRLITLLEVTPFNTGEARLMVNDPLPAGFEIDNPNLITAGSVPALDALGLEPNVTHAEFRQDRFLAALDRSDATPFRLAYVVRAISPGSYHHPAPSVEDMYRPDFRANGDAGRVTVTE
jgi:uncharacterized protein YfaS (alpha-2-macroglobulin family)